MKQKLCLAVLAWWAAVGGWAADQNYCDFTPRHTLCNYDGLGSKCGQQVPVRGVQEPDAAKIVAKHNQLRSNVAMGKEKRGNPSSQPKATNMMLMEWDNELAQVAQAHADQCIFQHDCRDCRRVARFGVGQNLYISFQSNFDESVQWERAIQSWYDEVAIFNLTHIQPFKFSKGVGHYTQMVWWNTHKIGCGFTMFKEGNWWKKLYTCNYGPAGNIISSQMYETGSPCSSCPDGTTCSLQYRGLCRESDAPGGDDNPVACAGRPRRVGDEPRHPAGRKEKIHAGHNRGPGQCPSHRRPGRPHGHKRRMLPIWPVLKAAARTRPSAANTSVKRTVWSLW